MRILEVSLATNKLADLSSFYQYTLELPVLKRNGKMVTFRAGSTKLTFEEYPVFDAIHHFAFNIPENQFSEAKKWIGERTPLIEYNGQDEFDFVNWNAHSLYFFDPGGNIVEFIARHDLDNGSDLPFSGNQIRSVSEVGLPFFPEGLSNTAKDLCGALGVDIYKGSSEQFFPMGDPEGLLIGVPIGRNWFPTEVPSGKFPISLLLETDKETSIFTTEGYSLKSQLPADVK